MRKFSFVWPLLSVFILLVFSFFVFGFQYEAADGIHANLFSGVFGDRPFNDFYYIALVGYGYVLSAAYSLFPFVPWYDILIYTLLLISGSVVLHVFKRRQLSVSISTLARILIIGVILFFLLLPNMLLLNQTRSSIFISAAGLLWIFHISGKQNSSSIFKLPMYYLAVGLFILGSLIRLEGGIATLVVFGCGGLFLTRKTLESVKVLIIPGVLLLVLFGSFALQGLHSDRFVHQVEPDIEYQISGKGNVVGLEQMKTGADSAKYMMAERWIVNDPEHISIAFLRSIIKKENDTKERLAYARQALGLQILKHVPLNILFLILTLISEILKYLQCSLIYFLGLQSFSFYSQWLTL